MPGQPKARPQQRRPARKGKWQAVATKPTVNPPKFSGATQRAHKALVPGGREKALDWYSARAFWNAAIHHEPPALLTSLGNYSVVNSVSRVSLTTSTTEPMVYIITWSESPISGFGNLVDGLDNNIGGSGYSPAAMNLQLMGSGCSAIRPLRMSFSLSTTATTVNREGEIRVVAVDQPMPAISFETGAYSYSDAKFLSGAWETFTDLTQANLDAVTYPASWFAVPRTFVSPPTSFIKYNQYEVFQDYMETYAPSLRSMAYYHLARKFVGDFNTQYSSVLQDTSFLCATPGMRRWVLYFSPTSTSNTYTLTINRQDACRFPPSTLGAAFGRPAKGGTPGQQANAEKAALLASRLESPSSH